MELIKPFLKLKANSLFIRLFTSFLIVIVMLVSFNFFSMTFSKNKIHDEIINYNMLNLTTTTDSYEKEFELIRNQLLTFFFNENVQQIYFDQQAVNYDTAAKTVQDIRQMTLNPLLYVNNVILYYKKTSLVLDKSSVSKDSTFFSKFYASYDYPSEFWSRQFDKDTRFEVYPPASFYEIPFQGEYNPLGQQIPVVVKASLYQDFYMAAFLDVQKMFQAFHLSINDNFFILDGRGRKLFSSSSASDIGSLPAFDNTKTYLKKGNYYFFYKKGSLSGLTYVNVVPDAYVASQVRLNVSLVTLLIFTIGISIVTSLLFSISFNNPIQRIIQSIKQLNALVPIRSRISEFNTISSQINNIHKDLNHKNSQLKSFAYISSLKRIHNNIEMDFTDQSFVFVVFELTYKGRSGDWKRTEQNWAYYVKEFVDYNFKLHFREPLTFQIETNQVLSFVFMDETDKPALQGLLEKLKQVFEIDKEEGFITIAVSSLYAHAAPMTEAYEEAL
ncbi:hypothetical protein K0U00_30910, partial [Paenibacillus sepulcri]|nr:hypothetical protein [Paenibacillus sepulcri]